MSKAYWKITLIIFSFTIGVYVFLYPKFPDFSLNLITEMIGILITLWIVEMILKKHYDEREKEIEKEKELVKWRESFEKDKQTFARYMLEISTLIENIANDVKNENNPDIKELKNKLNNRPFTYSFKDISDKNKEVIKKISSLLFQLDQYITKNKEYKIKKLYQYKKDIAMATFNILEMKCD
ncbi:hypothetical protein [Caminicella sporogenes]|uniref:hypothetical protein n=1 Tax=Caminicella sporogenes TaxID=166485 RepID=UPI002540E68A|nr:hypothetical protein [Caminicella sporogenes]WIF95136.1 hypothetical protein QNI18_00410 [Caminicella sporogenes]